MTTSLELHSNVRKDGRQLIQIKINHKDKRIRASTKIYIHKKYWKSKAKWGKWIKETHPEADKLNKQLEEKIGLAKDQAEKGGDINPGFALIGSDFFAYADNLIKKFNNPKSIGTWKNYTSGLNKLQRYLGKRQLPFKAITVQFIREYCTHLTSLENKQNTIWGDIKNIKAIYNQAIKEDVIGVENSPFFKIRIKKEKTKKERLSMDEIQKFRDEYAKEGSVQWHAKNIFLFCINTLGMRIGDAMMLRADDVKRGVLTYRMKKTSDIIRVTLTKEAKGIVELYTDSAGPERRYIFPYLNGHRDIYDAINRGTVLVNKCLGILAKNAKINKKITTHVARHTWTQLAINSGANPRTIQKALRHDSFDTTETYINDLSFNDVEELNSLIFE